MAGSSLLWTVHLFSSSWALQQLWYWRVCQSWKFWSLQHCLASKIRKAKVWQHKAVQQVYCGVFLQIELAPIQKLLPEELVFKIFEKLQPYTLGKVACVCQQWRNWTLYSELWKRACLQAFMTEDWEQIDTARQKYHRQKLQWILPEKSRLYKRPNYSPNEWRLLFTWDYCHQSQ